MISKIGFIGAGKVGTSLGKYFSEKNFIITGYYSKTKAHSADSAGFTNSNQFKNIKECVQASDTIFVTVPDGEIPAVWKAIKELDIKGKNIIHCSGAMSSLVFDGATDRGAYGFSLHPLFSINSKNESYKELNKAYFTVEGSRDRIDEVKDLMEKCGNPIAEISANEKTKYHAASVFVSNLVVGLGKAGEDLLLECGLAEDFSKEAWKALFVGNAENMVNYGLTEALTGPVERADIDTVSKHLDTLEGSDEIIYRELSRMILKIAKGKHPQRDYTNIDKKLKETK